MGRQLSFQCFNILFSFFHLKRVCVMNTYILVHYTRTYNKKFHILSISVLFFYYSNCSSSVHHLVLKVIALSINFQFLLLFSVSTCPMACVFSFTIAPQFFFCVFLFCKGRCFVNDRLNSL